jgi:hypothetical protein
MFLRPIELGSGVMIDSFPVLCGSSLFQRTAGSVYLKKPESKELGWFFGI